MDYGDLPSPYNRAVVTPPNVAHHAILDAMQAQPSVSLWYGATFTGLLRENGRVVGLTAKKETDEITVKAKVVVGADGAFSKVREALQIPADRYLYPQGYLNNIAGESLVAECNTLIGKGVKNIVLNFSRTDLINSSGISMILMILETLKKTEGTLCFTNMNTMYHDTFEMLGITKFLHSFRSEEDAIEFLNDGE